MAGLVLGTAGNRLCPALYCIETDYFHLSKSPPQHKQIHWCHCDFQTLRVTSSECIKEKNHFLSSTQQTSIWGDLLHSRDKWPACSMSGRADGFRELVSSSTGGRGLRVRGGEGDEPSAATCHHTALLPLLLLCGRQTGAENLIIVWRACMSPSRQWMVHL